MKRKLTALFRFLSLGAVILLGGCDQHMVLLDPKGPVGVHEKWLIVVSFGLMMLVAIPVFIMTFYFPWKYRASNKKATYKPKWSHSTKIELVVWLVPAVIVAVLGYLVWVDTHTLSPFRPLASKEQPVKIDAIAMDWKWLFVYPDEHIATVNKIVFPTNVPVNFRITSDTVMTSFFIPQLGSQIYAMAGMQTQDHLLASAAGTYEGLNSQFSGQGFYDMNFKAVATTKAAYQKWLEQVKSSGNKLDLAELQNIEKPSTNAPVTYYSSVYPHLFKYIINKYMTANVTPKKPHA